MQKILIVLYIWIAMVTLQSGVCDAAEPGQIPTPHSFLAVSVSGLSMSKPVVESTTTHQGFDKESLIIAAYKTLKADHSKLTYEEVRPLVEKVIAVTDANELDVFVVLALLMQESRFQARAKGDRGHACGIAQQHARFSMKWKISTSKTEDEECDKLLDVDYALSRLAYLLVSMKKRAPNLRQEICRYNEGPWAPCGLRGDMYWQKHVKWRRYLEIYYDRDVVARKLDDVTYARDLRDSYAWYRKMYGGKGAKKR